MVGEHIGITFSVASEHIEDAAPRDERKCAVALALRAAGFGEPVVLDVGGRIDIRALWPVPGGEGIPVDVECTPEIARFARAFDRGERVAPGAFRTSFRANTDSL